MSFGTGFDFITYLDNTIGTRIIVWLSLTSKRHYNEYKNARWIALKIIKTEMKITWKKWISMKCWICMKCYTRISLYNSTTRYTECFFSPLNYE